MEVKFKFQRRNCKLSLVFPPRRQSAMESFPRVMPNSILYGISDFKFSTQLVSTVVVAAITVFQVRFEFLAAARILCGASFNL